MPWKESRIMDQRLQFLASYQKEEMSVADLCRAYGISRPTAYRWINRYNETGPEGLVDRSRRPHSCSHATLERIENAILALRAKHPSWGARKLKARLEMLQPEVAWPAASTFGNILSRSGLTSPQKRRKRTTPCSEPFSLVTGPNQLWCMDFKGYFATGDGKRCDPFTITDACSRYLIRCQIVSRNERPHEGLNNQTPASLYHPSSVRLPRKLPEFTYSKGLLLRRVNNSGDISWHKNRIFISEVFRFEELGLELITPGFYKIFFRDMEIGELNAEELRFRAARRVD